LEWDAHVDKINDTHTLASCGEGRFVIGKEGRVTQTKLMKSFGKLNYDIEPLYPFTSGEPPICTLEMSDSYPIPVILLSLGRSGSTATWQVMSRLTGRCFRGHEYTGSTTNDTVAFFSRTKPGNNGNWVLGYFCYTQRIYKDRGGIIGFKWKPYKQSWDMKASMDGLRMIAHHRNPQIKIIRSKRNLLDVIISREKHKAMTEESLKVSFCLTSDIGCIDKVKKFETGIHLRPEFLLDDLLRYKKNEDTVDETLKKLNVAYVDVSYEKLYQNNTVDEWRKIFRYLGRGPDSNLTPLLLERAMNSAVTHSPFHNASISNYEEIRDLLTGTEFGTLLH